MISSVSHLILMPNFILSAIYVHSLKLKYQVLVIVLA